MTRFPLAIVKRAPAWAPIMLPQARSGRCQNGPSRSRQKERAYGGEAPDDENFCPIRFHEIPSPYACQGPDQKNPTPAWINPP
jgi:hypothetical protein